MVRPVLTCIAHVTYQSESQDQVFLRWTTGETATMHILVVHAMVILLTLGPPKGENGIFHTGSRVSVLHLCKAKSPPLIVRGERFPQPSGHLVP